MPEHVDIFGVILGVMLLEGIVLAMLWATRQDRRAADSLIALSAGLALVGAAAIALSGGGRTWVYALLFAAFVAHLGDLRRRWLGAMRRDHIAVAASRLKRTTP